MRETVRVAQHAEHVAARVPDGFVGLGPEREAGKSDGSGKVRDSGVVSDETEANL